MEAPDAEELRDSGVLSDARGCSYHVSLAGKTIGTFSDWDIAFKALKAAMERESYWPAIYHINDHGNVELLNGKGKCVRGWV
jgi:hypothetical protein